MTLLQYSGNFTVQKGIEDTTSFMKEPGKLFGSIPGVESVDSGEGRLRVKFRLDLENIGITDTGGYLSTITSVMLFDYELNGHQFSLRGKGRSAGSSISTNVTVILSEEGEATRVTWEAEVDPGLILRILGEKKVSAVSGTMISMVIEGFRNSLKLS